MKFCNDEITLFDAIRSIFLTFHCWTWAATITLQWFLHAAAHLFKNNEILQDVTILFAWSQLRPIIPKSDTFIDRNCLGYKVLPTRFSRGWLGLYRWRAASVSWTERARQANVAMLSTYTINMIKQPSNYAYLINSIHYLQCESKKNNSSKTYCDIFTRAEPM